MTPEALPSWVSRIRLAVAIMAAACAVLAIGVASASATTTKLTDIEINEVESDGDKVHGDWIELYNTGEKEEDAVDLSGAILSDNDNSHEFTIPSETVLEVEEWIAFRVDDPGVENNFGLGKSDSARLFKAEAVLGVDEPVDSYTWTAHAATTYGATPDGSDEFDTTATGTFGAENEFGHPTVGNIEGIKLNEVESNGDVENGDWVELYNTTGSTIDISGAIITDNNPAHRFLVPSSTTLGAGGYAFFRVDDPGVEGHYGLGSNDEVKLYPPNDVTLSTLVDQFSWSSHAAVTYGRNVAGAGTWEPTSVSTPGAVNQFSEVEAPDLTGVVINEAESHGDTEHGDWIELKNTTGVSVDLDNAILSDSDNGHVFRIPTSTPELGAGELAAFRVDDPTLGDAQFGLGDEDKARLFEADTVDLAAVEPTDSQSWTTHAWWTYGLNGSGEWVQTNTGTFGTANNFVAEDTPDISFVVINEIVTTGDAEHGDWVELLNTSEEETIDIGGAIIADESNEASNRYTIPAETLLEPGATYVLQTENTAGFGLGKKDAVRLFRSGATVGTDIPLDHHEWSQHAEGSYARQMDGLGVWIVDATPTYNATNE